MVRVFTLKLAFWTALCLQVPFVIAEPECNCGDGSVAPTNEVSQKKRFQFRVGRDDSGNLQPEATASLYWGKSGHWYSQIDILQVSDSSTDKISGFSPSKRSTSFSEQNLNFRVLAYEWLHKPEGLAGSEERTSDELGNTMYSSFSSGLELNYRQIQRGEFGYLYIDVPGVVEDWVAFDNEVNITTNAASIAADYFLIKPSVFKLEMFARYALYSDLKVEQQVEFRPLVDSIGEAESMKGQKAAYDIGTRIQYMLLPERLGLSLGFRQSLQTFEYQAAVLSSDLSGFVQEDIETQDKVNRVELGLIFGGFTNSFRPTISMSEIAIESEDGDSGDSDGREIKVVSLGLEGVF